MMRSKVLSALAVAALLFSGCNKEVKPAKLETKKVSSENNVSTAKVDSGNMACSKFVQTQKAVLINKGRIDGLEKEIKNIPAPVVNSSSTDSTAAVSDEVEKLMSGMEKDNTEMKNRVKYLEDELARLKKHINSVDNSRKDIKDGKTVVETYCKDINLVSIDPNAKHKAKSNVLVRPCPNKFSKALSQLKKGAVVKFKGCNMYGWCELEDGSGFVAGFLFDDVKTKKGKK